MRALVAVALVGCTEYAHTSLHNAPGAVDLSTPLEHENGAPGRYEIPSSPGQNTLAVYTMPYLIGGVGRINEAGETGLEMRFEYSHDYSFADRSFAITAGVPSMQWHGDRAILGAFYAEANYRTLAGSLPFDIGLGPAIYSSNAEIGGQLTVRLPLLMLRLRYMPDSRFEVMAGTEIPIGFFFSRSR
jgi:hypothetical protein